MDPKQAGFPTKSTKVRSIGILRTPVFIRSHYFGRRRRVEVVTRRLSVGSPNAVGGGDQRAYPSWGTQQAAAEPFTVTAPASATLAELE